MKVLFSQILSVSVYGSVIIAAVMILRLVLRRAPKKIICLLWLLAAVRLLMPFEIESKLSLQPELSAADYIQNIQTQTPSDGHNPSVQAPAVTDPADQPVDPPTADTPDAADPMLIASGVWLAGASVLAIYSIVSYMLLKRQVRNCIVVSDGVWQCPNLETAFVLGFFRPQIYLNAGMSAEQQAFVLQHERCHIRRGDHWWKLLGFFALAVHWFNPLVWIAYALLCRDLETACDEMVVKNMDTAQRKAYSAALLQCSVNRIHLAACPVAFGEVSIKGRIKNVLHYRKPGLWITATAVIAVAVLIVCFLTNPASAAQPLSEEEQMLLKCQQAIEDFQTLDSYDLRETKAVPADVNLAWTTARYLQSGDDWFRSAQSADWEDQYLQTDGRQFTKDITVSVPQEEIPCPNWIETDLSGDPFVPQCWLTQFVWDSEQISFDSAQTQTQHDVISICIKDETLASGSYTLTFRFDTASGQLTSVIKTIQINQDQTSVTTYEILSTNDSGISAAIDAYYQQTTTP